MKKYLFLFLYLFIAALNYNLILKPLKLVTGGTQGLSLIITSFINIKDSIVILLLSYFLLSKNVTKSIVVSSFLYPISIKITSFIPRFTINNTFIFSIVAGTICGITGSLIYRLGFSSGGVSTINLINNKFFKIKVSISNFIVNLIIILLGIFRFGVIKGMYSIIVILVSSIFIDVIFKK